ncbi:MAG: acetyl-CoA carboxylase biotin carboxyl carrier protein [Roseibacillus sp.]|nr:acetyl-CoA carboxylase biotin carboxyl carrier protein [Roseibacillus sp.]
MELKEIKKIVELMNEHGLTLFHLEKEDFNLKLKKGPDAEDIREALGSLVAAPAGPAPLPAPAQDSAPAAEEPIDVGRSILSPMVGTYYRKPAPDADDFVAVGDKVSEGDILCIIEAMKVMNEIKAETSGTITELCVEDSTPVQYGDVLFRLK